jgi:hypothetical protein
MLQQLGTDALEKDMCGQCAGNMLRLLLAAKQDLGFPVLIDGRTSKGPTQTACWTHVRSAYQNSTQEHGYALVTMNRG